MRSGQRNQLKLGPVESSDLGKQLTEMAAPAGAFEVADMTGAPGDKGTTRILGAWLRQPDHVWFFKMMGPADLVGQQKDAFVGFLRSVSLAVTPASANAAHAPLGAGGGPANPPMGAMPVVTEQGASLLWTAPPDWTAATGSATRRGSYKAGGAEIAITAFPGDVGGVLANVNRWRGQAGLDPVDDAGLAGVTTSIESQGLHITVADASGAQNAIVAAIVPWNGGTWFFKLMGPPDAVRSEKPAFLSFLQTVRTP
jgi:hypothetical protein